MAGNPINAIDPNGAAAYYLADGTYLFDIGDEDAVYYWQVDDADPNNAAGMGGTGSFTKVGDLSIQQFNDLAGTLYAEGDQTDFSAFEAAGIYSVLENRAGAINEFNQTKGNSQSVTPYDVASTPAEHVNGWSERDKINDRLANPNKIKASRAGLIIGVTSEKDYSNGAYFWHGRDLGEVGSGAYNDFYLTGLNFTNSTHDIHNLGSNEATGKAFKYTYETTGAYGRTTFMRLTDEWIKATKYPKRY